MMSNDEINKAAADMCGVTKPDYDVPHFCIGLEHYDYDWDIYTDARCREVVLDWAVLNGHFGWYYSYVYDWVYIKKYQNKTDMETACIEAIVKQWRKGDK